MTDKMSLKEMVDYVMRATGRTRRQARQDILRAARAGKITLHGINAQTGVDEPIPRHFWDGVEADD